MTNFSGKNLVPPQMGLRSYAHVYQATRLTVQTSCRTAAGRSVPEQAQSARYIFNKNRLYDSKSKFNDFPICDCFRQKVLTLTSEFHFYRGPRAPLLNPVVKGLQYPCAAINLLNDTKPNKNHAVAYRYREKQLL